MKCAVRDRRTTGQETGDQQRDFFTVDCANEDLICVIGVISHRHQMSGSRLEVGDGQKSNVSGLQFAENRVSSDSASASVCDRLSTVNYRFC